MTDQTGTTDTKPEGCEPIPARPAAGAWVAPVQQLCEGLVSSITEVFRLLAPFFAWFEEHRDEIEAARAAEPKEHGCVCLCAAVHGLNVCDGYADELTGHQLPSGGWICPACAADRTGMLIASIETHRTIDETTTDACMQPFNTGDNATRQGNDG